MKRVLIVEDDRSQRYLLWSHVEKMGYIVFVAASVSEAVARLDEQVDIILLDLHLPNGHGFDVLRKLAEKRNDVPVVVISGHPEERRHREKFPILSWVDKPYSMIDVTAALTNAERSVDSLSSLKESTRRLGDIIEK